jgi:hypothetical protein
VGGRYSMRPPCSAIGGVNCTIARNPTYSRLYDGSGIVPNALWGCPPQADVGYWQIVLKKSFCGEDERILPAAIVEKFVAGPVGELVPLIEGSTSVAETGRMPVSAK